MTNIEVELEHGFENYHLPEPSTPEEIVEAVRFSWHFLDTAPMRITAPLLAAAYAAPLSEIVVPDFTIWLYGGTGSFKSTICAVVLSHFGDFSEFSLPLSFESTSNALERSLFLAKDVMTVVDDWRPGVTQADSGDMDRKCQRVLRAVGNRQGRGRMTERTTLRESYPPRGMVVVTAEALPEGPAFQSAAARAISINLSWEDVDLEKLSKMQEHKEMLSLAMAGYIQHLASRYDELARELPDHRKLLRERKLRPLLEGAHPRTPSNAVVLVIGLQQLRDYSISIGAMDETEAYKKYREARDGIVEAAKAHSEATSGGDPASRFIDTMRSLFESSRIYVKNRETEEEPPDCQRLGWEKWGADDSEKGYYSPYNAADFVGWADEEYLYLDKDAAYAVVSRFAQRGGLPFGIKPRALWDALARSKMSIVDAGRTDTTAKIRKKSKRVVQIRRSTIFE